MAVTSLAFREDLGRSQGTVRTLDFKLGRYHAPKWVSIADTGSGRLNVYHFCTRIEA